MRENARNIKKAYKQGEKVAKMAKTEDKKVDKRVIKANDGERWVSEFIKQDEYEAWQNGIIFLACGVGRGKTKFVLDKYCKFLIEKYKAEDKVERNMILYLCNRKALRESISKRLDGELEKVVEVMSYQSLQMIIREHQGIEEVLKRYKAIVCDEAHYFISDSFNRFTGTALDELVTAAKEIPVIFITATYEEILSYLDKPCFNFGYGKIVRKIYELPTDYSYVKNICFYKKKYTENPQEKNSYISDVKINQDTLDKLEKYVGVRKKEKKSPHKDGEEEFRNWKLYQKDGKQYFKKWEIYIKDTKIRLKGVSINPKCVRVHSKGEKVYYKNAKGNLTGKRVHTKFGRKQDNLYRLIDKLTEQSPRGEETISEKTMYFCNSRNQQKLIFKNYLTRNKQSYYDKSKLRFMVFKWSDYVQDSAIPKFMKKTQESGLLLDDETGEYSLGDGKKLLISTKCLDNGIDFTDESIKHIISDITDMVSLIQCLGRKRADTDGEGNVIADRCNFYFQDYQASDLYYQARVTNGEKEQADTFRKSKEKWYEKYGKKRDFNNRIFYTEWNADKECVEMKLNELYYEKLKSDSKFFRSIIGTKNTEATTTYRQEVLKRLGITDENDKRIVSIGEVISNIDNDEFKKATRIALEEKLQEYAKRTELMGSDDREEFTDNMYLIDKRFSNPSGDKMKRVGDINTWLQENGFSYKIKTKRLGIKKDEKPKQPTYWLVENHNW